MKFAAALLATVFLAGEALAETPQSIIELLKADYDIINVSPIAESYAVFLQKDEAVVVCQMGFKDGAFSTDKCYPLTR
ncbi:hypothetical protein GB928_002400 [Shinella curvata]|uniref:Uncharacterized protein n=1 Tax=Shinella curvata TaxID=1817964 RepID=A0ABT8X8G9_9HYPH|nr:hypothetical protein [Shinella curvata]MCJ8052022.1 hypothetical protein [Shinella curvata]MDO6120030.1 hypothetical protein [Shinella curvata]